MQLIKNGLLISIHLIRIWISEFRRLIFFWDCFVFRWTIKARVSNKGAIRTYENARGPGKLFSCDLVDQSGEIRATAFNAECDKFHSLLEIGEVDSSFDLLKKTNPIRFF